MAVIMKCFCFSLIILASFATFFSVADARRFNVGGNGVWGLNPKENYKTWAERNRFQVNDTLYLKYAKGSDSVQEVMKVDFFACNVRNPIKKFNNGESVVTLERSGPFYFISGNEDRCKKGQKMIVVVLAVRDSVSPANPPSIALPPKSPSPVSPISPAKPPSMAKPPKSPSPVSPAKPPSSALPPKSPSPISPISPAKPPSSAQPPKSPSPISPAKPPSMAKPPKSPSPISPAKPPAKSTPPKPSVSPIHPPKPSISPSHAPSPKSPSPSPSSSSPANPPKSAPSPTQVPASSPSPSDVTPISDTPTAPAPAPSHKNSASVMTVTSVMSTVLTVAFTVFA